MFTETNLRLIPINDKNAPTLKFLSTDLIASFTEILLSSDYNSAGTNDTKYSFKKRIPLCK